ncbi:hypothetical protein WKT02_03615 [Erysipelotrichaceae bacterium HCN-30851]
MAIYDILCEVKDLRQADNAICEFNGFLEDYLSIIENTEGKENVYEILSQLFEKDHNLKVCVNLRLNVNKDAIANQIIRYKDSFKMPRGTIQCPFVIYGVFDEYQKAMILTLGDKEEYVKAKALYYVMSEPENEYEGTRNEIVALSVDKEHISRLLDTADNFFIRKRKAGIVQRELDAKLFENYDEMYGLAQKIANDQIENIREILRDSDDKETCINAMIANWFLMKKFSYVQYMMDKNNLNRVHEGNVKKQRQVAKEKCDAIGFISYSEMWKMVKEMR